MNFMAHEDTTASAWTTVSGIDQETGEQISPYEMRTVGNNQHVRFETR